MAVITKFPPRTALSAEANHRIGNNLAMIAALVRQQAAGISAGRRPATAEEVLAVLREVATRIEIVARLHRLLAEGELNGAVDLGNYLADVADMSVSSLACAEQTALTHAFSPGCMRSADQAILIGVIVCELVTNAVKYAHPTGVAGKIRVGCHRTAEGRLLVEIADDGVGLPEGFDPMTQGDLGLRLVRSLAAQLGARLRFHSGSLGLGVRLQVPAAEIRRGEVGDAPNRLPEIARIHPFPSSGRSSIQRNSLEERMTKVETLREQAHVLRSLAEGLGDDTVSRSLVRLAGRCDELAAEI